MTHLIYDPNLDRTYDLDTLPSLEREGVTTTILPELPRDELEKQLAGLCEQQLEEELARDVANAKPDHDITVSWGWSSCVGSGRSEP